MAKMGKWEPPLAYLNSLEHIYGPQLPQVINWQHLLTQLKKQIQAVIAAQGEYRVNKTTGVFIATNKF